jgi:hypothetical protein
VAQCGQFLPCFSIPSLGLVAEREQRLVTASLGASRRDLQNFVGAKIGARPARRRMSKRAIVAGVSAKLGERDAKAPTMLRT